MNLCFCRARNIRCFWRGGSIGHEDSPHSAPTSLGASHRSTSMLGSTMDLLRVHHHGSSTIRIVLLLVLPVLLVLSSSELTTTTTTTTTSSGTTTDSTEPSGGAQANPNRAPSQRFVRCFHNRQRSYASGQRAAASLFEHPPSSPLSLF